MATTTIQPLPYPLPGDPADGPAQIKALAEAVETRVVMRFPSPAARDAALPSGKLVDGMMCHVASENAVYLRSGGQWRVMWAPWRTYDATLSGATGSVVAGYSRVGQLVHVRAVITLTAVTNAFGMSTPSASAHSSLTPVGGAYLEDVSASGASSRRIWAAYLGTGSTIQVMNGGDGVIAGPGAPWTWASGDRITIDATYETIALV